MLLARATRRTAGLASHKPSGLTLKWWMPRSILAGIIAPTTKAVDAAAVLARMLVPEPMRPGWPESLHHAHSVIPHERLLSIDERFANAAAKPARRGIPP